MATAAESPRPRRLTPQRLRAVAGERPPRVRRTRGFFAAVGDFFRRVGRSIRRQATAFWTWAKARTVRARLGLRKAAVWTWNRISSGWSWLRLNARVWGARAWHGLGIAGSFALRMLRRIPVGVRRLIAWPLRLFSSSALLAIAGIIAVVGLLIAGLVFVTDSYNTHVHSRIVAASRPHYDVRRVWNDADAAVRRWQDPLDDEVVVYEEHDGAATQPAAPAAPVSEIDTEKGVPTRVRVDGRIPTHAPGGEPILYWIEESRAVLEEKSPDVFRVWNYEATQRSDDGRYKTVPGEEWLLGAEEIYRLPLTVTINVDGQQRQALRLNDDNREALGMDEQALFDLFIKHADEARTFLDSLEQSDQIRLLEFMHESLVYSRAKVQDISFWFGVQEALDAFVIHGNRLFETGEATKQQSLKHKQYMSRRDGGDIRYAWYRAKEFREGWTAEVHALRAIHHPTAASQGGNA